MNKTIQSEVKEMPLVLGLVLGILVLFAPYYILFTAITLAGSFIFLFIHTSKMSKRREICLVNHRKDPFQVYFFILAGFMMPFAAFALLINKYGTNAILYGSMNISSLTGTLLMWSSLALSIHAKMSLSFMFYDGAVVQKNHILITEGPYSLVRHPLYLSYTLISTGSCLLANNPFIAAACFACVFWGFNLRADLEEHVLLSNPSTSKNYSMYASRTPKIIPTIGSVIAYLKHGF